MLQFVKYFLLIIIFPFSVLKAQPLSEGIKAIDKNLTEDNPVEAERILQGVINKYFGEKKADSLVNYLFYVGKVAHAKNGTNDGIKQVDNFINKIKSLSPGPATLRQAYIEAAEYYGFAGKNKIAYQANDQALKYTLLIPSKTGGQIALVENNLATYAQRMGDLNLSQTHQRSALKHLSTDKNPNYETLYIAYNGMGTTMWYTSKIDSASYFFTKALAALDKTERTPINQFYRPAVVQNNLSALYQMQGKTSEGINAMKRTIENIEKFLASKEPHPKKGAATSFQYEATDNLAGIYKELGDLKQAQDLLEYSYQQKQKHLEANSPGIFISQILLGQLYYATKDFDKALQYLNTGLARIEKSDGNHLFWKADACNTLALLHDSKKDFKQAAIYYERADSLYEASLEGEYDNIYLDFLRNAALFYAENGNSKTALQKANKGYNYVVKTQGPETLLSFYQLLNLSEVYLLSGEYKESAIYSNKSLSVVNNMIRNSENLIDSIKIELKKPKAVLMQTKAAYELLPVKNVENLTPLLSQLNEALSVIERRKSIVSDAEDISLMMADHTGLIEFVKKINLELFKITKDKAYINRIVSLHESALYNRIRSRLDRSDKIQFAHVPNSTQQKEKQLKSAIAAALTSEKSHDGKMKDYFYAVQQWNNFQEKLRTEFPRYYTMRYASIFRSLRNMQEVVPEGTTLVRYFFNDKKLFAYIADKQQQEIVSLSNNLLEKNVTTLSSNQSVISETSNTLHSLYQQLWSPLAPYVRYKKVVIIPDGILYNLSFETLTPTKITSYKELATKSLLASHSISYQYSLFLLQQQAKPTYIPQNFIAFAPGFSDKIKAAYKKNINNGTQLDRAYLSLLPQPFTINLATKIKDAFGGKAYINEQSTESIFKQAAGNNKIIHIGTHAESNNQHPEFSRLIFAKNNKAEDDNSLYVDEIYNCDLSSNLTVLTACESGKPGYQDGEGMISLAHAFNYAGSESILTGLWKIDEQASANIVEKFYENLHQGMAKDEALRQAKLAYLQESDGRILNPQYWAGLVIMGNTAPIVLEKKHSYLPWLILGFILLASLTFYSVKKNKTSTI